MTIGEPHATCRHCGGPLEVRRRVVRNGLIYLAWDLGAADRERCSRTDGLIELHEPQSSARRT